MSPDDFSSEAAMVEAASAPGAQVFVFPGPGVVSGDRYPPVEAVLVLTPDRLVWDLRTENALAWFARLELHLGGVSDVDIEAQLSHWCEWVPRAYRGLVLGAVSGDELGACKH